MHLAPSLKLPGELEHARDAGKLVVFAGAGVSMGPPARLPSFLELAREIAEPSLPLLEADKRHLDRYLHRAERQHNVLVQERAREKLGSRGVSHTPLHQHLLGLFAKPANVRLITTNFDTLFSSAAKAVFGTVPIVHYVGPALPPGHLFQGIVQLHGSLDHIQNRLVLTQGDFATAYMTDGWASRFLVGAFDGATILFVGYSLADPLMQYLVKALPPTNRWYALCEVGEQSQWVEHGVQPVTFTARQDGERFGDLQDGLERWCWYARASSVDHDLELRRLIALGPPVSPQDSDYVRARLATEGGRLVFWDAADQRPWFEWAASEGLLDRLFDPTANEGADHGWAQWSVTRFCLGSNPPLLSFVRRRSLQISPAFARQLAIALTVEPRPSISDATLRQLIALIVSQAPDRNHRDRYGWLLGTLAGNGHTPEAMALLRWMTTVRLRPPENLDLVFESEETDDDRLVPLGHRTTIAGNPSDMRRILEEYGQGLVGTQADELVILGEQRLIEAYEVINLARADENGADWISYGRTAIAPSNQDSYPEAEDVLVDLVRIGLDAWSTHAPEKLLLFRDRYTDDTRRLLKRLAIYATTKSPVLSPDDALVLIIQKRWPTDIWVRPELYALLKQHYAAASDPAKEQFIAAIDTDAFWSDPSESSKRSRYSLSQYCARLCPDSSATQNWASTQRSAHPDWREQDPDGYLARMEVAWGGQTPSPISADELLDLDPSQALERIIEALQRLPEHADSFSLIGSVRHAIKTNPMWGIELLSQAIVTSGVPSSLLRDAAWGFQDAELTHDDQRCFLERATAWQLPDGLGTPLGFAADRWIRNTTNAVTADLLDLYDRFADHLFDYGMRQPFVLPTERGWTELAINHPAGHAASIWWTVANIRDRVGEHFVLSIDDAERGRWERVLSDTTAAGAHARPFLGMALDRLSSGDAPWAQERLFPAFNVDGDQERAAQLWDGRLTQRQWTWATITGLKPQLQGMLRRSAELLPARARELGDCIALLIAHHQKSGLSINDLHQFVIGASPEARRAFVASVPRHVATLESAARIELWRTILQTYWQDRQTNVPVELDIGEIVEFMDWVGAFEEVASDIITTLESTRWENLDHADDFIWRWSEDDAWLKRHPEEAARMIKLMAERRSISPWHVGRAVENLEAALSAGATRETAMEAAQALAGSTASQAASSLFLRLRDSTE